ncbi:MAG: prepilin-type N-terminal cleavage/methylation domain-containing protein [Planctomycetes bacterium]|nr:prepilin-type N-terminal cleavage/methylation domain-containing protein [Planctomycetota bacterium]
MNRIRGLTLIEVLAATVLLSMLAASCIPLLRLAMTDLRHQDESFDLIELSLFVDEVLSKPTDFNLDLEMIAQSSQHTINWPDSATGASIIMRRLVSDNPKVDHAWLCFTSNGQSVFRWIPVDNENDQESQP